MMTLFILFLALICILTQIWRLFYVVDGEITHKDSMGNSETLKRGEVQYLSAEMEYHSEHNLHKSDDLRLLQIWIIPPKAGLPRLYGS